jgi:hypothetical protein
MKLPYDAAAGAAATSIRKRSKKRRH